MAKQCVLEQKLLGSCIWGIDSYQNERHWPLFRGRFKVTQPLRYIWRWISWKPLEAWFQRTTNRKWHMGYQMVTWPITSRDPKGETRDPNPLIAQYLENRWRCYLATVCCKAIRSAILATAWLLVLFWTGHGPNLKSPELFATAFTSGMTLRGFLKHVLLTFTLRPVNLSPSADHFHDFHTILKQSTICYK